MSLRFVLAFCLLAMARDAVAQVLRIGSATRYDLKDVVYHLEDTAGDLTFNSIRTSKDFKHERSVNYGFDDDSHWFKVDVKNESDHDEFLLEIAFASLDEVNFYYASSGWIHKVAGDEFPISARDIPYQHPVFKFKLAQGATSTIYLKVRSTSSLQLPVTIWEPEAFLNRAIHLQIFNGLFYGAMMLMILYQLFLFLSIRERMSLYYVFTLVAMIHVVSYFQGYSFLYIYPESPGLNRHMGIFTGPLFLIFSTWFARAFLGLQEKHPVIDILLIINVVINCILTLMMVFKVGDVSFRVHHYAVLVHCILALTAAGLGFYNKFKPALYYLLSWLTLLVAAVIFSMSNLGFFKEFLNPTSSALIIACLVQMLLISFALVNRWHNITRENQLAKEQEIHRKEIERERLEHEVRIRTEKIREQNEKLEEVNRIKDKLFSVVSHDIKGPLTSLRLALSLTKSEALSQEEFRELTDALETRFNQTTEFIENLLQWARVQLKGEIYEPTDVDFNKVVSDTLGLFMSEIESKSIQVTTEIDGTAVYGDVNMLKSIMRNLIMNAVKFTRHGGAISVKAKSANGVVTVSVSDTGIGIPEVNRDKLFSLDIVTTPGTKEEKGTGLGLILCKEFVERNGGKIWFISEEGKGSTFSFTIPASTNRNVA